MTLESTLQSGEEGVELAELVNVISRNKNLGSFLTALNFATAMIHLEPLSVLQHAPRASEKHTRRQVIDSKENERAKLTIILFTFSVTSRLKH